MKDQQLDEKIAKAFNPSRKDISESACIECGKAPCGGMILQLCDGCLATIEKRLKTSE